MSIIEIIVLALKIAWGIMSEVFGAQARARAADEKYQLDRAAFFATAQKVLDRLRDQAAKESHDAQNVEDRIDQDLGKKP